MPMLYCRYMKSLDVIAIGSCYVDMNVSDYPFSESGIANETEIVGGKYETVPGGSAVNFCRLLSSLGLHPGFIGVAGADSMGDVLEKLLTKDGVQAHIIRKSDVQTNISFNMTSPEGGHIMCVAGTANATISPDEILPVLQDTANNSKAIYIGGCFKLNSFQDSFSAVVRIAREHNTAIFIDHGRIPKDVAQEMITRIKELVLGADYYLASRNEFLQLWGVSGVDDGIQLLHKKNPKLTVVIKDGENGAYYSDLGIKRHIPAAKVKEISNLTGAGDSFNAGFMAALSANRALPDAVSFGCAVAAAKISGRDTPTH